MIFFKGLYNPFYFFTRLFETHDLDREFDGTSWVDLALIIKVTNFSLPVFLYHFLPHFST
jgi:hypothetical protein